MKKKILLIIIGSLFILGCSNEAEPLDWDKLNSDQLLLYEGFYRDNNYSSGKYFDVRYESLSDDLEHYESKMKMTIHQTGPSSNLMILENAFGHKGAIIQITVVPKTENHYNPLRFSIYKNGLYIGSSPNEYMINELALSYIDYDSAGPYYIYYAILEGDYGGEIIDIYNYYTNFDLTQIKELKTLEIEIQEGEGDDIKVIETLRIELNE